MDDSSDDDVTTVVKIVTLTRVPSPTLTSPVLRKTPPTLRTPCPTAESLSGRWYSVCPTCRDGVKESEVTRRRKDFPTEEERD